MTTMQKQRSSIQKARVGRAQIIPPADALAFKTPDRPGRRHAVLAGATSSSTTPGSFRSYFRSGGATSTATAFTSPLGRLTTLSRKPDSIRRIHFGDDDKGSGVRRPIEHEIHSDTTDSEQSEDEVEEDEERRLRELEYEKARKAKEARAIEAIAALREPLEKLETECRQKRQDESRKAFAAVKGSFAEMAGLSDAFRDSCSVAIKVHSELTNELAELSEAFLKNAEDSIAAIAQHLDCLSEAYQARKQSRDRFRSEVEQMRKEQATKLEHIHKTFQARKKKLVAEMSLINDLGRDEKKLRETLAAMLSGF